MEVFLMAKELEHPINLLTNYWLVRFFQIENWIISATIEHAFVQVKVTFDNLRIGPMFFVEVGAAPRIIKRLNAQEGTILLAIMFTGIIKIIGIAAVEGAAFVGIVKQ